MALNKFKISKRTNCRICNSSHLSLFFSLKEMPFTDEFSVEATNKEFIADIDIFFCQQCFTVQTLHDVQVDQYYSDYQYSVGDSTFVKIFMKSLATELMDTYYPNESGKKILEIGSSDGQQLLAFKETGCHVLGYEPSSALCKIAEKKGIPSIQGLFTSESIEKLPHDFKEVDVVMLSYTFDHLPDPISFLKSTAKILNKKNGLLVVEIHNFEKIVERQEYCLFEHEHSIYLTEMTASKICQSVGLVIIDFDLIPEHLRRANSLIFIATPINSIFASKTTLPRTPEKFSDTLFYKSIGKKIHQSIQNIDRFVNKVISENKKIIGYGAGGRGVMTLAAICSAKHVSYVIDKKPKGNGILMPKTGIPVYDIQHLKNNPVDVVLVFSFGYMNEILTELSELGYKQKQLHSLVDVLQGHFEGLCHKQLQ